MDKDTKIELLKIFAMVVILILLIIGIVWMNKEQPTDTANNTETEVSEDNNVDEAENTVSEDNNVTENESNSVSEGNNITEETTDTNQITGSAQELQITNTAENETENETNNIETTAE